MHPRTLVDAARAPEVGVSSSYSRRAYRATVKREWRTPTKFAKWSDTDPLEAKSSLVEWIAGFSNKSIYAQQVDIVDDNKSSKASTVEAPIDAAADSKSSNASAEEEEEAPGSDELVWRPPA